MAELAKEKVEIRDFPGLASRVDPNDVLPGAATVQINVTCVTPGALSVRGGLRPVQFEE